jgi:hypothetical protein
MAISFVAGVEGVAERGVVADAPRVVAVAAKNLTFRACPDIAAAR